MTPAMVPSQPRPARKAVGGRGGSLDPIAVRIHNLLLKEPDLPNLYKQGSEAISGRLAAMVRDVQDPLSNGERESLYRRLIDDVLGLGPLQPLLDDPAINDILVNTHRQILVDVGSGLEDSGITFNSDEHLRNVLDRIVSEIGRRIDETSPMVDARLADGSRVNAVIPPLALDGPLVSIRKFRERPFTPLELVDNKALSHPMMQVLEAAVRARLNILISGGTSSGKTTLLNALSFYIGRRERIITIEDAAELQLNQPYVARLETRPPNIEGKGQVRQRELLINSLRMRPDRILLGEVRGEEALDVLQAMNTGHEGSLTTIHSNSPRDALSRLETMCLSGNGNIPIKALRDQIASAIHLVIQAARMSDGSRRITHISEITGMAGDIVSMQDIFLYERKGIDSQHRIKGAFRATGIIPRFQEKLRDSGIALPESIYDASVEG